MDIQRTGIAPIPRPRWQHDADRARELIAAIHDYSNAANFMENQSEIAFEWFDELHELAVRHLPPHPEVSDE